MNNGDTNAPTELLKLQRRSAAYLAIASVATLFLLALLLSGYQAIQRFQLAKVAGAPISYFTLLRLANETNEVENELGPKSIKLANLQAEKDAATKQLGEATKQADQLEHKQDSLIDELSREVSANQFKKIGVPSTDTSVPRTTEMNATPLAKGAGGISGNYLQKRAKVNTFLKDGEPSITEKFVSADKSSQFRDLMVLESKLSSVVGDRSLEISGLEPLVKGLRDRQINIARFEAEKIVGDKLRTKDIDDVRKSILDVVEEMRQTSYLSPLMSWFPEELIVVLIVIVGGLLGSAVFLTYDYVEDTPPRKISFISLRLLVGALTALLLFIVIKAGVIVAIDPSLKQSGADLNPFFVAFVGVLGGLISHEVVSKILSAGNSWFQEASSAKERYALPTVATAFSDKAKREEFIKVAGFSAEAIDRWIKGGGLVSPNAQRSVSLFLHQEVRELFSDIPPPMQEPAVKAANDQQQQDGGGKRKGGATGATVATGSP